MRLLVAGGAGYIGSAVGALLVAEGHDVIVLDDLSTGHEGARCPPGASFVRGTLRDDAPRLLADGVENAVLHLAAKSLVGESVARPSLYWGNNLGGSLALLEAMRAAGTPRIVFSSTAAVYGEPETVPIDEAAPTRPTSPYGASKVAVDTALAEVRPDVRPGRDQPPLLQHGRRPRRSWGTRGRGARRGCRRGAREARCAGSASGTRPRPTSSPTCSSVAHSVARRVGRPPDSLRR